MNFGKNMPLLSKFSDFEYWDIYSTFHTFL